MGAVSYPTLEHVAQEARPYPVALLDKCETGLCLFAAAFCGHNDAVHFAEAGLVGTCVDIDGERLLEMRDLYPPDWTFTVADAWKFADTACALDLWWDAVSIDTFTGDAMCHSLDSLDLWCSLARRFVTVTLTEDARDSYRVPQGWNSFHFQRAQGVYWLVLERE